MTTLREKITGMFMGVAIGDALGMPVEKMTAAEIKKRYGRITIYLPPGKDHKWHKDLKKGMWTDDTQLTLATAEGLMSANGFFMPDIAKAHVAALENSASGWGPSTRKAVERLKRGVSWDQAALTGPGYGQGNGVVMKIGPLAVFLHLNPPKPKGKNQAIREFTCMTHKTPVAVLASLAHVAAIEYCLTHDADRFRSARYLDRVIKATMILHDSEPRFMEAFLRVCYSMPVRGLDWSVKSLNPNPFHILHSVPLSHAIFLDSPTSFNCVLNAVAAGGDTDTNASIVGGLFGALNGIKAIPVELICGLHDHEKILEVANSFCDAFIGKEE